FKKLGAATEAAMILSPETGATAIKSLPPDSGAIERFWILNKMRMNMFLPASDPVLPWTALLVGLWIPNFYYWGLNQYITQRTLGSASLAQGQRGIVFAAFLKLLIPFVIVIPGIIAFNLYSHNMRLEAVSDTARSLARYVKANPETRFVEVVKSPTDDQIASWQPGRYMLAVYPDAGTLAAVKTRNPFVLPLTQSGFDELSPRPFTLFKTDDKSWGHVNGQFAAEVEAYNQKTERAAKTAGATPAVEKLIAFKYDTALGQLLGHVLPQGVGIVGFVLAALLGAVVSSLAAMLNAASTIFAMDVFKKHLAPQAEQSAVVRVGRISVVVFAIVAVLVAPQLGDPKISNSIFTIIQAGQGFISPGVLAVFVFGLVVRRGPPICGVVGLVTNLIAYGAMMVFVPKVQFLNRMAICFALCLVVMAVITLLKPLPEPVRFQQKTSIALESSGTARTAGMVVVAFTLLLYFIFSPACLVR
ncbi:MAG: hypothetical protein N3G20_11775, partial [Verrucomicrobiae bacterium]|nr:hypothetical protein [Verrucomicrobiae bacterium]